MGRATNLNRRERESDPGYSRRYSDRSQSRERRSDNGAENSNYYNIENIENDFNINNIFIFSFEKKIYYADKELFLYPKSLDIRLENRFESLDYSDKNSEVTPNCMINNDYNNEYSPCKNDCYHISSYDDMSSFDEDINNDNKCEKMRNNKQPCLGYPFSFSKTPNPINNMSIPTQDKKT